MEFDVKNTITLNDDKEYMIMSKVEHEGVTYLFLMNVNDEKDYKFCNLNAENKLFELKDDEIIHNVAPLLYKKLLDEIENI